MNSTATQSFGGSPQVCLAVSIPYYRITSPFLVVASLSCVLDAIGIITALSGNSLVVLAISLDRSLHCNAEFVLLNLAVCDLLMGGLAQPLIVTRKIEVLIRRRSCTTANVISVVTPTITSASLVSRMLVTLERSIAVLAPYWYEEHVTTARLFIPAICLWFITTLVKLATLFTSLPLTVPKLLAAGSAVVCILVTLVGYFLLVRVANRHEGTVHAQQQQLQLSSGERTRCMKERKALWTAIHISSVYFLGYLPSVIVTIITVVASPSLENSFLMRASSGSLACCISAVNPFILSWKNRRVARKMRKILGIGNSHVSSIRGQPPTLPITR